MMSFYNPLTTVTNEDAKKQILYWYSHLKIPFYSAKNCYTKSPTPFHMWFLQKYLGVFIIFVTHCTKLATILRPNFHEEKTQKRI